MPGVPGILDVIGVGMLGPTIIAHGTDEQKGRYLGAMLHGDEVWCQLFSEPAAGSDLAAVQTRAKQNDDGSWTLNGQKVWTTNAQFAAYGLLLARTNADVPKHKGMTMFIVPMDGEGVTVRGLRQISGEAEFNEVFFDDVTIDADSVVGGVDNGWGVGSDDAHVRAPDDRPGHAAGSATAATASPARSPSDPAAVDGLGRPPRARRAQRRARGDPLDRLPLDQRAAERPDPRTGVRPGEGHDRQLRRQGRATSSPTCSGREVLAEDNEWAYMISFLPGLKSAGGTEEILRNTIGERVLGLPPEPRLDKGIPFSELRAKEKEGAAA